MGNGMQNNGGSAGRGNQGNRQRRALTNGNGPAVPPPALDPQSAQAYAGQTATATSTLYDKLAALKAQMGLVRGQFQMDKAAVKAAQISGQVGAEDASLQRGIVGSSIDLAGHAAVDATAAQGLQAAIQTKVQGVLGLKTGKLTAIDDYYTQLYQIQAEKAAAQAAAAAAAMADNSVLRPQDKMGENQATKTQADYLAAMLGPAYNQYQTGTYGGTPSGLGHVVGGRT